MERGLQGVYQETSTAGEKVKAFVPYNLPPIVAIEIDDSLQKKMNEASHILGKLDCASELLPDVGLFLYMFIRKEAVLSSQIEGTQSSLSDLLLYEIEETPGVPVDDVQEVSNYVAAINYGVKRLQNGFPLSLRLIREIHQELLAHGRGSMKSPGEFRRSQNWIGGTRPGNAMFVPPPPEEMAVCLNNLELFLHNESTPALIKVALSHVQFETIHPFLDGNGRIGRLLISLLFCENAVLKYPLLYLSYYFKLHRQYYYDSLNAVRFSGDWERWLDFFFDAIIVTGKASLEIILALDKQIKADSVKINSLGRVVKSAMLIHQVLLKNPISSSKRIKQETNLSDATINNILERFQQLGIVHETTSKKRNRLFCYQKYFNILNAQMDI